MSLARTLGRPSWWVVLYGILGFFLVVGYARAAVTGWSLGSEEGAVPQEVRTSQHGYRDYSYWHHHHVWYGPSFFFWSSPSRGYRWGK
jgi:hypothetical protein